MITEPAGQANSSPWDQQLGLARRGFRASESIGLKQVVILAPTASRPPSTAPAHRPVFALSLKVL